MAEEENNKYLASQGEDSILSNQMNTYVNHLISTTEKDYHKELNTSLILNSKYYDDVNEFLNFDIKLDNTNETAFKNQSKKMYLHSFSEKRSIPKEDHIEKKNSEINEKIKVDINLEGNFSLQKKEKTNHQERNNNDDEEEEKFGTADDKFQNHDNSFKKIKTPKQKTLCNDSLKYNNNICQSINQVARSQNNINYNNNNYLPSNDNNTYININNVNKYNINNINYFNYNFNFNTSGSNLPNFQINKFNPLGTSCYPVFTNNTNKLDERTMQIKTSTSKGIFDPNQFQMNLELNKIIFDNQIYQKNTYNTYNNNYQLLDKGFRKKNNIDNNAFRYNQQMQRNNNILKNQSCFTQSINQQELINKQIENQILNNNKTIVKNVNHQDMIKDSETQINSNNSNNNINTNEYYNSYQAKNHLEKLNSFELYQLCCRKEGSNFFIKSIKLMSQSEILAIYDKLNEFFSKLYSKEFGSCCMKALIKAINYKKELK